ncbi:hypothetical protein OG417_03285 [Actinoallomurus sp. NBC_01490]|jgi:hypothetical protein|uniref:hypothetical protein n=1 Tax=Actinoallomurus sp. NBC_01490 TaxID=2903557 RepID=UPI002E357EEA|nr:hypothetical protein [Actinoallomurus sp. NBC_01490]
MSADLTKRRDKLARQLGKLEDRGAKIAADLRDVTEAWQRAVEDGSDTKRHADKRRALALDLEDVNAEAAQVRGWLTDVNAELEAIAERTRREQEFVAESERYAADVARLAEVRMYTPHFRKAAAEVLRIAQRVSAQMRESARLDRELPDRQDRLRTLAEQLGVDWRPPPLPQPPADLERPSDYIARAMFAAANRSAADVAEELGKAAGWEQ